MLSHCSLFAPNCDPVFNGTITLGGAPVTVLLKSPGQTARLTFAGTAGQRLTLQASDVSVPSSSVAILNPDGSPLATVSVGISGASIADRMLPAPGTYGVLIDPEAANTGVMTLALHAVDSDPVSVTLSSDGSFPAQAGSRISWTAVPSGGVGPFEYQFWLYSTALDTWRIVQDFSGKQTFRWVPAAADTYMVRVRIRTAGLTGYENSATSSPFDVTSASTPVVSALSASLLSPVPAGTTITWRATASGGAGPLLYQFWIHDPVTGWFKLRDYEPSNIATWTPRRPGQYDVQVWVRTAGSIAAYDAWRSNTEPVTIGEGEVQLTSVKADKLSPIAPGTSVIWNAQASEAAGELEFQFQLFRQSTGAWTTEQAYGPSSSWTWNAAASDQYAVRVRVRTVGSTADYEATWDSDPITVVSGPVVNTTTTVSQIFPTAAPTSIRFTARASGGTAPLEYKFYLNDVTTNTWILVRDWAAGNEWVWQPAASDYGVRAVQVWIRSTGSTAAYEAYTGTGYFVLTR